MFKKILITVFACCLIPRVSLGNNDISVLATPPMDSIDAASMDIWVPVENIGNCRVVIDIYDKENNLVRNFMDEVIPSGYHHFYWDKKDDSGLFVAEGDYLCRIKICNKKTDRKINLKVKYLAGEKDVLIRVGDNLIDPFFEYEILSDSARLTLEQVTRRKKTIKTIFSDSLFVKGDYRFDWEPDKKLRSKDYRFILTVDDYRQLIKLVYRNEK